METMSVIEFDSLGKYSDDSCGDDDNLYLYL